MATTSAAASSAALLPSPSPSPSPSPRPLARASSAVPTSKPLTGKTIVLDPGHNALNSSQPSRANAPVPAGGFTKPCNTSGTSTNAGYAEHAYAWDVAVRAAALLRSRGARVVVTRPSDAGFGPCVNERAALANRARAAAFVSIHADGGPASGYGFHVIEPGLAPDHGNAAILAVSARLASALLPAFRAATGEPLSSYTGSRGLTKRSDLAGLNLARVPAVFLECGNMRNASDAARLSSATFRQKAAAGITSALVTFLSSTGR